MPLRLIFMGTPEFAVPTLLELVAHGHEIAAVYTRAPKPAGRGMKLQPTPVEQEARRLGIPVLTPTTLKTPEALEEFRAHDADAAVVVAYGMILPQAILDAPKLGCFNLHASLLPRWRGAAPINRAIMAGDAETGVMVMKMDAGLDTGDVAMAERIAITDAMTASDLHDALARLGGDLMVRAIGALERGRLQLTKQSERGVTYAAKIEKAEARIDWNRPAREVLRHIHGLSPFPGAWCEMPIEGQPVRVKILRCAMADGAGAAGELLDDRLAVACKDGALRILELQRAGKAPMKAGDFLRGTPLKPPHAASLMPRYKLTIEYDGAPFCGWQIQDNGPSVQGALEDAVKAICGEQVRVHGAGRTDAGVHALGQVAHCDIAKHFVPGRFRDGLNAHLRPHPIGVLSADIVPDTFEARFSAKRRHYRYRISNRRANLALDIGRAWRLPRPLDTDAMHVAAQRAGRQARLHHLSRHRMPGEIAGEDPRPARRHQGRRRRQHRDLGALVPAQPGALDGGLAGLGRRGPLEPRRSAAGARRP